MEPTTAVESLEDERARKQLEKDYRQRQIHYTTEQQEFIEKKLSSKLWRLDNLYTIMDKDARKTVLHLNQAQRSVLERFKHNKKIILKSRQQGISTLYLAYYLDSCLFQAGYQAGIQSYGLDESEKLSKRAQLMWDELDPNIKELFGLKLVSNNSKGMTFSNGSILKIGNFRGDTLQGLHVSELAKIAKQRPDKAEELKTGAFQAVGKRNKITIESTAEGKSGLFYQMWQTAELVSKQKNGKLGAFDFQPIFLSWVYDSDCAIDDEEEISKETADYLLKIETELNIVLTDQQKWWYVAKKRELGDKMGQEYPYCPEEAFAQSVEGTYYANEFKTLKIGEGLYDPQLKVFGAIDWGVNDDFPWGFFQVHPNGKVKIIGEYSNNDQGLQHYRDICDALSIKFGWVFGSVYVPHDIVVKEAIADKTRIQAMRDLGWDPILVKKHKLADGIQTTREFLKEVEIQSDCDLILGAIQNYRKKYDKTYDVFLDTPVHDGFSHPADMIRYMAMGMKYSKPKDIYVNSIYNVSRKSRRKKSGYDV